MNVLLAYFLSFNSITHPREFNPLPHMPILWSSNSATNKDMKSKI